MSTSLSAGSQPLPLRHQRIPDLLCLGPEATSLLALEVVHVRLIDRSQMASRVCMAVAMAMALFVVGATAQLDCTMALNSLTPCMTYVTGPSATPTQVCCDGIRTVSSVSSACLCQVIAGLVANKAVNQTKASGLPSACNVQLNTASCPAASAPTSMPPGVSAPAASPPSVALPPSVVTPPMSSPPSPPTTAPPTVPAMGPGSSVPAMGPGSASSGDTPAPTPATSEGSVVSASMAFAVALTGAVVAFAF